MGFLVDKEKQFAIVDRNGSQIFQDVYAYWTRQGLVFYIDDCDTTLVNIGDTREILFRTFDKPINVSAQYGAFGGSMRVDLFEDPVITDPGTAFTIQSLNRISTNVSECNVYFSPTYSDPGTDFKHFCVYGESDKKSRAFSVVRHASFRILNPNTDYLVRLTAITGGTVTPLGYGNAGGGTARSGLSQQVSPRYSLGLDVDGNSVNTLSLVSRSLETQASSVRGGLAWKEFY